MLELRVGNQLFSGWTSAEITRSLEAISGAFTLTVTRESEGLDNLLAFAEGNPCTVSLHGQPVITGNTEGFSPSLGKSGNPLTIRGRDASGVLVKCSPPPTPASWSNQSADALLNALCAPFGIPCQITGVDIGQPFPQFTLEPSDKVADAIRRLCEARGLLVVPNRIGGLTLVQLATALQSVALREGHNLKSLDADYSTAELYTHITVRGQSEATPSAAGRTTNGATYTATGRAVPGYQPLTLQATGQATAADCERQAHWEMANRNGKALTVRATVAGWQQEEGGPLWDINQRVQVDSPSCYLNEAMIISEVTYRLDKDTGTETTLSLVRPTALLPQPAPVDPPPKQPQKTDRQTATSPPRQSVRRAVPAPQDKALKPGTYRVGPNGQLIKVSP